jgi:phosphoglycolate phosphatase
MSRAACWDGRGAVLFDLDGTLADTAADLCAAANALRQEQGLSALPLSEFRPWVSRGGKAMLEVAFPEHEQGWREDRLVEFLDRYSADCTRHTRLFPGMAELLAAIESAGLPWGVVTNKPFNLASAVLAGLGLSSRCAVLLGGDSLARKKPDPLQLTSACEQLGVAPACAIYLGDDQRDVQAAKACGMPCVAAAWGYLPPGQNASDWGADLVLEQPLALLAVLGLEPIAAA